MLYIIIAAACCAADQLFKKWIVANIALGGHMELIPGVLSLTNLRNTGMAFSMLSKHTWLLSLISAAVIIFIAVLLFRGKFTRWEKVCMAVIMGGAAGNLIDRVLLGYVVDMFETEFVDFAVFNLADAFIDVGAVLFCVLYIVRTVREDRKKPEEKAHDGDADSN